MSGIGTASYLHAGADGSPLTASPGDALYIQGKTDKVRNLGKWVLRINVVTQLPDLPVSWVQIDAKSGNKGNIWVSGYGSDVPAVGVGKVLVEGSTLTWQITNLNQVSMIPEQDGDTVYITVALSGQDTGYPTQNQPDLDLVGPTYSVTQPSSNINVSRNQMIYITANKALNPNTINSTNITVAPSPTGLQVVPDTSNVDNIIVYVGSPNYWGSNITYTITVGTAVTNASGYGAAAPFTYSFTTTVNLPGQDTTIPTVISSNPLNGATSVNPTTPPTITFSEPMLLSSVNTSNVTIAYTSNNQLLTGLTYSLSSDQKTLTIGGAPMTTSTQYTLNALGGGNSVTDLGGNHLASTYTVSYTTAPPPTTTVYNVSGNGYFKLYYHYEARATEMVMTNASLLNGRKPVKYTFPLYIVGYPTGTIYLQWLDMNQNLIKTLWSKDVSTITSGTIFTVYDNSNTRAYMVGDSIGFYYLGGDSYDYVNIPVSTTDAFDGSNTHFMYVEWDSYNYVYRTWMDLPYDLAMSIDCLT